MLPLLEHRNPIKQIQPTSPHQKKKTDSANHEHK